MDFTIAAEENLDGFWQTFASSSLSEVFTAKTPSNGKRL